MTLAAILLVLAGTPTEGPLGLDVLSKEATVIAFGRVTSIRPRGDIRVASLSVTVQLKGAPQSVLTFVAESRGCCQPVATVGAQALYFLTPSRTPDVLRVAGDARGVFSMGFINGVAHVQVAPSEVVLDPRLWASDGGDWTRPVRAAAMIQALGFTAKPPSPAPPGQAMFEAIDLTCEPCSLDAEVAKLSARNAVECGVARTAAGPELKCLRETIGKGREFRVSQTPAGIDSAIQQWFLGRPDGGVTMVQYDSDTGGGLNLCHAAVFTRKCTTISISGAARNRSFIECGGSAPTTALCKETERTTEMLKTARPASLLRCGFGEDGHYADCLELADRTHKITPSLDGGNYVCEPTRLGMMCRVVP